MQCYRVQKRREPKKCGEHTVPCCQPIFFWNIISSSYMVLAAGSLITYTTSSLCWILIWFYFFLLILNTSILLFLSTVLLKSLQTGSNFCPFEHLVRIRCFGGTVQFSSLSSLSCPTFCNPMDLVVQHLLTGYRRFVSQLLCFEIYFVKFCCCSLFWVSLLVLLI